MAFVHPVLGFVGLEARSGLGRGKENDEGGAFSGFRLNLNTSIVLFYN